MTERSFIAKREEDWKKIDRFIEQGLKWGFTPRVRRTAREQAAWFPQAFRQLTGDLNTARSNSFDPVLIDRLNRMTMEGNQILYGARSFSLKKAFWFLSNTFPRALRFQWKSFGVCFLIFFGLWIFTAFVCVRFPGFVYELMSPWTASSMESMYNPQSPYYLQPRNVKTDADMFGYYIYNNISLAFMTFAGGLFAGVGSLLILAFNGIFLGAATGHIINKGFYETFFSFIIGHSAFELTAIVLAAQAGFRLGYRLFITGGRGRGAALREAGGSALPLMGGAALMLVIAAAIEAFWSSRHEIPADIRFAAGGAVILLVTWYFVFAGRKKERQG
jgi:uncharacterized membrane protein SpoIIM required for sporulation